MSYCFLSIGTRQTVGALVTGVQTVALPIWRRHDWKGTTKCFRHDQACVYEANGVWHGYLMSESGIADTITGDREEDQDGDGLGFGERELSFPPAEEMIAWIDYGYPIEKAAKIAACKTL